MDAVSRWNAMLEAIRETRGIESQPFDEAQLDALRSRGMPESVAPLLSIGYPAAPVRLGTLTFFPRREVFAQLRSFPELFFVAEGLKNPNPLRRRLGLDDDLELVDAATDFVRAVGEGEMLGREALRARELVFWLPRVENALHATLPEDRVANVLGTLGVGVIRWDDYQAEIEKRLLVARSFFLIGLVIAIYLLTRNGSLPGRLVGAGASLGVVGVGLGLAPWLRENARLRRLQERG